MTMTLPGVPLTSTPKPELRRTEVQNLLTCDQWQGGSTNAANFGSTVHLAIAAYLESCRRHGEQSRLGDVDQIARQAFLSSPTGVEPSRFGELLDLVQRFARTHLAPIQTLLALEMTLRVETDAAFMRGTVDMIERLDDGEEYEPPTQLRITDWKTQFAKQPHEFQGMFYACLTCLRWPCVEEVSTRFDHIRLNDGIVETEYRRAPRA